MIASSIEAKTHGSLEIARVLVRFDHVARFIINVDHCVILTELRRGRRVPRGGASSRKRRRSCGWSHPIVELRSRREVDWS